MGKPGYLLTKPVSRRISRFRTPHEQEEVPGAAQVQQGGAGVPERDPQHDDLRREALPGGLRRAPRPQVSAMF